MNRAAQPAFRPGLLVLAAAGAMVCVVAAQDPQPPVFRGRVALVPVDVRVVDRQGNPVRDLTREDFTLLENGVPQVISHFVVEAQAGDDDAPSHTREPDAVVATSAPAPRTFLIVLGRGRLQGPSRGFDALLDFVDRRTLPGDRIGFVAYDRVTELTTDRVAARRFVERYREHHIGIEAIQVHWFSGLTEFFGDGELPRTAVERIRAFFDAPDLPRSRALFDAPLPGEGLFEEDRARALESVGQAQVGRPRDFTSTTAARQDLEKLYAAVESLRFVDGEKHLVFITYEGLLYASHNAVARLGRMAADARVTLSSIQTGGLHTSWTNPGSAWSFQGPSASHMFANRDMKMLAEQTGGVASIYRFADDGLRRLEQATRLQYVLGYYPANPEADGDFRRITVRVNRPGVEVLYRRGYYARPEPLTYDRQALLTDARIASAAGYRAVITDLPLTISASTVTVTGDGGELLVQIRVAPDAVTFTAADGRHAAALDIALYVGDRNRRQIGELRKRVDLNLTPGNHARVAADGIAFSATVPYKGRARHVKAVVYEYASDRLGSAVLDLER